MRISYQRHLRGVVPTWSYGATFGVWRFKFVIQGSDTDRFPFALMVAFEFDHESFWFCVSRKKISFVKMPFGLETPRDA